LFPRSTFAYHPALHYSIVLLPPGVFVLRLCSRVAALTALDIPVVDMRMAMLYILVAEHPQRCVLAAEYSIFDGYI